MNTNANDYSLIDDPNLIVGLGALTLGVFVAGIAWAAHRPHPAPTLPAPRREPALDYSEPTQLNALNERSECDDPEVEKFIEESEPTEDNVKAIKRAGGLFTTQLLSFRQHVSEISDDIEDDKVASGLIPIEELLDQLICKTAAWEKDTA